MDKFEQAIKNAQEPTVPSTNFVEETMQQIAHRQPEPRNFLRIWAPALVGGVAVLAIIFLALPAGSHQSTSNSLTKGTTTNQPASPTTTTPSAATDDASLTSDLTGINTAMNQENTDQNSATSALNDQSQQIAIPTD